MFFQYLISRTQYVDAEAFIENETQRIVYIYCKRAA